MLRLLIAAPDYARVVALTRRPPALEHSKLEARRADFEHLDDVLPDLHGAAALDVYCCLGTTIRKAGSQAAFRRVDHDYVMALARWSVAAGARRLLVVSAIGADPASRVFYNRIKGETERDLVALGPASLVIARPSLLDGDREQWRPGERIALLVTRPLRTLMPARFRPIHARDVAAALVLAARDPNPAPRLESAQLQGAAQRLQRPA